MDCSTPGFPVLHHLPELAQTHVHGVSDAIQPSHPLSSPCPSCLQSFPASGSFPMSQFFVSGGQIIGTSALAPILVMNIQGWFHLGWTGLISMLSKGLSRISSTKVQIINSSVLSHFYHPALTSSSQVLLKEVAWLFATAWPVAYQASLSMGILQARILEWVVMLSSRGSFQPRDRTQISHIASGFFTVWATRGKCLLYLPLAASDIIWLLDFLYYTYK